MRATAIQAGKLISAATSWTPTRGLRLSYVAVFLEVAEFFREVTSIGAGGFIIFDQPSFEVFSHKCLGSVQDRLVPGASAKIAV